MTADTMTRLLGRMTATRVWTGALLALAVAATTLSALPVSASADGAASAWCARDADVPLSHGVPPGWEVETATNTDGGEPWHRAGELGSRSWRLQSDVAGHGVKDDRLVTPPFVATAATKVTFDHGYLLGEGAGGVLEISTDDGRSWTPLDAALVSGHRYDGGLPDGTAAFTGLETDWGQHDPKSSTADLSGWSGQHVRLAWRLLVVEPTTVPGWWAVGGATLGSIADAGCVDGTRPQLRCTTAISPDFADGIPEGWQVVTAVNESDTPVWRPQRADLSAPTGIPNWLGAATEASGLGAKDDSLVSAPFTATETSWLGFDHRFLLERGRDGGVLEVSRDDGVTWESVEVDRFLVGPYQGTLAEGRPAWTGSDLEDGPPDWHGHAASAVDLSALAGEELRIRWRLLQDDARPESLPGRDWFVLWIQFQEIVEGGECSREEEEPPSVDVPPDECTALRQLGPPQQIGAQGTTDEGQVVSLDVHVAVDVAEGADIALLERSDPPGAQARMEVLEEEVSGLLDPMRRAYEPLGIEIALSFDLLAPLDEEGNPRERDEDTRRGVVGLLSDGYDDELLRLAKEQYGHRPPPGADLVYVATDVPMGAVAGRADCVGGIGWPQHAFALGTIRSDDPPEDAKVAGHEVGHLLGAHHHYANCAETLPDRGPSANPTGMCTIMTNDVLLIGLRFSTANGAIVRGYAVAYADEGEA